MSSPPSIPTRFAPRSARLSRRVVAPAIFLVAAALATTAGHRDAHAATPSTPAPQGDAERGLALYDAHCAGCHGPTGHGDGPLVDRLPAPPPSLADRSRMARLSAADLWSTVTNGRLDGGMPPFSRLLTDAERWDVVATVRAFGDQHPLVLADADGAFARGCASCHGAADDFADELAAAPPPADAPPGADGLAMRSPAAMLAAFAAVAAHDGTDAGADATVDTRVDGAVDAVAGAGASARIDDRTRDAALAGLRRHGSRPLALPGAAPGGRIEGRVVAPEDAAARVSLGTTATLQASALGLGIDLGAVALAPDGAFAVDGLVVGDGIDYEPEVVFDGVRYRPTDAVTLTAQSPIRTDVVLHVFAADPAAPVQIAALSGLAKADAERGEVAVFEIWQIANTGQRTRVSAGGAPTFRLPLPVGAKDVVLEDRTGREDVASRSDASDAGYIASRLPVPPGGREIVASYAMPYRGTSATLERTLVDGAERLGWVLADPDAVADSPQLTGPTSDTFGDNPVTRYVGGPVAAGQRWTVRVRGLPLAAAVPASPQDVLGPAPPSMIRQDLVRDAALVLAAIAVLAALLVGWAGRRTVRRGPAGRRAPRAYDGAIAAIARLDARYERGEVAPNAHRRRRATLVARALALRSAAGLDAAKAVSTDVDVREEG